MPLMLRRTNIPGGDYFLHTAGSKLRFFKISGERAVPRKISGLIQFDAGC
jgi:hypothetical protein